MESVVRAQGKRVPIIEVVKSPVRLDAGNVKETLRSVRAEPGSAVILDLADAVAIDSAALGEIVKIHRRLLPSGGTVALAAASNGVRRTLALTGLDTIFQMHGDVAHAIGAAGDKA